MIPSTVSLRRKSQTLGKWCRFSVFQSYSKDVTGKPQKINGGIYTTPDSRLEWRCLIQCSLPRIGTGCPQVLGSTSLRSPAVLGPILSVVHPTEFHG